METYKLESKLSEFEKMNSKIINKSFSFLWILKIYINLLMENIFLKKNKIGSKNIQILFLNLLLSKKK